MANQYDTNLKLQAIADAIGDTQSSGLIQALEDIADAVAGGGGGGSSTAGLVSDNFSETDTYDLGDYCIHNNTLYVCINAITTPGPWDLSDWQATNAGLELSSLNSALTNLIKFADAHVDLAANTLTTGQWTRYVLPWNLGANANILGLRATISSGSDTIIVVPSVATNTAAVIWVYAKSAQSFATSIYAYVSYTD